MADDNLFGSDSTPTQNRSVGRLSPQSIRITGIDIPFFELVGLLVKVSLAAIPAAIIVWIVIFFGGAMLVGVFSGVTSSL